MVEASNPLSRLELPKRWEHLIARAAAAGLDPSEFVEKVDTAATRIDTLLKRVRTGGGGLFEIIIGLSGSGKTTFLNTLPRFFDKIRVQPFARERSLAELPSFIKQSHVTGDSLSRIVLVERRDIPKPADLQQVDTMLVDLLEVFREPYGKTLVLWPITDSDLAGQIAAKAWKIGRDSLCDPELRGLYPFKGVPKERYYSLADATSRSLSGDGLQAFGIDQEAAKTLLPSCETIADFFAAVDRLADTKRDATWSILKARVRVRLWVLLPGDDVTAINSTASALTQGTRNRIDIDLIGEFLDHPDNKSIYVADWKKRRASVAHLLRAIDVRLFALPPNVALAAVRSFGDDVIKKALKQPATNLEQSKNAMKATRLYKAILGEAGIDASPYAGTREIKPETEDEFRRIQALASKHDKLLNKALGALLAACLKDDAPNLKAVAEKRKLPKSSLSPDIQIELAPAEFICLEPTWRSTGKGIQGELKSSQNTLAEAHLKKYVLEKATQYVKDLEL